MADIAYDEKNWEQLHTHLRDALQEEVRLTRELLANMNQEELSLMLADQGSLNQVLSQQFYLFEKLSLMRAHRHMVTVKIEKIVLGNHKCASIDEILPPTDETTTEIHSLSDQLMALTERLNRQHCLNKRLTQNPNRSASPHFQHAMEVRPKKKASVATFNIKR